MNILLDDNGFWKRFAPLSLTRPIGDLRIGIFTNAERWKLLVPSASIYFASEKYLSSKFPSIKHPDITINACVIPTQSIADKLLEVKENEVFVNNGVWLAKRGNGLKEVEWKGEQPLIIEERWHLYQKNEQALLNDFELATNGRNSEPLSPTNTIIGNPALIFVEKNATVEASILNTTYGPIFIGTNAEIMEGSIVRGAFAMLDHSTLKLGSKIYGATTLGPHCKVGGEINNVIFQAYSNKSHDGFLGNSLIGQWCNLGAGTNSSNLKNNYGNISTYSYEINGEQKTDVQFMGLCMGDHSKCAINTMFNTATVVGVSSNIFGEGFPPKFVPSFSWGTQSMVRFRFEKAIQYATNMMARRNLALTAPEVEILKFISDNQ